MTWAVRDSYLSKAVNTADVNRGQGPGVAGPVRHFWNLSLHSFAGPAISVEAEHVRPTVDIHSNTDGDSLNLEPLAVHRQQDD